MFWVDVSSIVVKDESFFIFAKKKRICEHHLAPVSMSEWWKSSTEHEQNKNCCVKLELESGDIWQFAFCFSGTWYNDKISKMKCRYIIFTALAKRRRMRRRRMEKKSIKLKILDDGERDWKRCFVYFIHFEHFVRFFKWVFIFFFHFFWDIQRLGTLAIVALNKMRKMIERLTCLFFTVS